MKLRFFVILLLIGPSLFSQENKDSMITHNLYNEILSSSMFQKSEPVEYLSASFQRYIKVDSTVIYDVLIDSLGNLDEYIGVTLIFYKYNPDGELIERIGRNLSGEYYLWDYSPIIKFDYYGDTTSKIFFDKNYLIEEKTEKVKDSLDREIMYARYNKDLNLVNKTIHVYNDSLNEFSVYYFDGSGKHKPNKNGVCLKEVKYDPLDPTIFIGEKYFDCQFKLLDSDHRNLANGSDFKLEYSVTERQIDKYGVWVLFHYNSLMELVCKETPFEIIRIIRRK